MKDYLNLNTGISSAEDAEDAIKPTALLENRLLLLDKELESLATEDVERARHLIEKGYIYIDLSRLEEANQCGHDAFKLAITNEHWQYAVEALDVIFMSEQTDAVIALGHGIWLAVTFPIDPELSIAMLQHLIDESPDRSDGAAVAAATACYIVSIRIEDPKKRSDLTFFTNQLLGQVARKHSQVEEQEIFDFWVEQLELNSPEKFIPRLAQVVDVIVDNNWWFDRDEIRQKIPEDASV